MKAEMDAVNGMRQVTMNLRIKRGTELVWRIWLGKKLLAFAALVMNCNIQIEDMEK